MALSPNRHIDGAGLLQCLMQIPSDIAYKFFQDAPGWFYEHVSIYFQTCRAFVPTVMPFVELDIRLSKTSQSLFREDSVTSKFLACASIGPENGLFLHNVLAPTITATLEQKNTLELNPLRVEPGMQSVEESAEIVKTLVQEIIHNLGCYIFTCPMPYRVLLRNIQKLVVTKFPEDNLGRSIICSFLFLRMLCPALVSPHKYKVPMKANSTAMFPEEIPTHSLRTLVVISKVLQAIGNGTGLEESKEEWMQIFAPFIEEQTKNVGEIFDIFLSADAIASLLIHSKEFQKSLKLPNEIENAEITKECETFIRDRITEEQSLGGYLYHSMRIQPEKSKSHPITWTPFELHAWMRSVGLEKYIPAFINNDIYGIELLRISRQRLRSEFGIVRFMQQTEITANINTLVQNSTIYLPTPEEMVFATAVMKWNIDDIIAWLEGIECTELCKSTKELNLTGRWLLRLTSDDFCYLGLPPQRVDYITRKIRELEAATHYDELRSFLSKASISKKQSTPTLFDEAIDKWLQDLHLSNNEETALSPKLKPIQMEHIERNHVLVRDHLIVGLLNRKRGSGSKWKMRWFVLNTQNGVLSEYHRSQISPLFYSKDIAALKPLHNIHLAECAIRSVTFLVGRPNCFSIARKNKHQTLFQAISADVSRAWIGNLMKYTVIVHVEKLNIEMFSTSVLVVRRSTEKIMDINGPGLTLFGYKNKSDVVNKNIRTLLPNVVNISLLFGKEQNEMIQLNNGMDIRANIKVSLYEEGEQERVLVTLRPKIVLKRPSSTQGDCIKASKSISHFPSQIEGQRQRRSLHKTADSYEGRASSPSLRTSKTRSEEQSDSSDSNTISGPVGFLSLLSSSDDESEEESEQEATPMGFLAYADDEENSKARGSVPNLFKNPLSRRRRRRGDIPHSSSESISLSKLG